MKFEHQLLHSGKFTAFLISVGVVNAFVKQQKGTNRMIVIIHILGDGVTGVTGVTGMKGLIILFFLFFYVISTLSMP